MAYGGIDLGTKIAIVGVAVVGIVVMRALERYAHIRARKRTQRAIDRVSSS
jgi:hypothetical protein